MVELKERIDAAASDMSFDNASDMLELLGNHNLEIVSKDNEEFQHTITGRVCKDKAGKEFIKFSTYLSFLQISFRVYLPGLMRDTVKVYASFHLKRPGENRDGTPRKKT